MNNALPGVLGGVFFIFWFLMMAAGVVGWIIALMAIWRAMKAHESIASSLQELRVGLFRGIQAHESIALTLKESKQNSPNKSSEQHNNET